MSNKQIAMFYFIMYLKPGICMDHKIKVKLILKNKLLRL